MYVCKKQRAQSAAALFAPKWAGRAGENETNCADNLQHFAWARQFGLCHYWVSRPLLCAARRGWVGETDGRFLALSTPAVAAAVGPHLMHVLTQQPNDRQLAALDLVINFIIMTTSCSPSQRAGC
jgi:hypothetical protein